jgi:thermitase
MEGALKGTFRVRISRWWWAALVVAAILGLAKIGSLLTDPSPVAPQAVDRASALSVDDDQFLPGELLVKLDVPLPPGAVDVLHRLAGAETIEYIPALDLHRLRLPEGVDAREAAAAYGELPWVEYAEPNYIVKAAVTPNDPLYRGNQAWYYDLIRAPAAWEIESGDPSIVVAVLDTGIDLSHAELDGQIWINRADEPDNDIDDDQNGCIDDLHGCNFVELPPSNDASDDHGHGSMVAGVIGAKSDNGVGVTGTAWGVTLMPVKVLDSTGSGSASDVAQGIIYAAKSGAQVINLSMARTSPSSALAAAAREAHNTFGVILVAATGNEGASAVGYPAAYPEVIAVGAFQHADPNARASFSNWGPEVNLAAPGVDVFSTDLDGGYARSGGTSFAAAFVSGQVALLLSQDPLRSDDDVRLLLRTSADDLPDGSALHWDGWGRMNIAGSLNTRAYQAIVPGLAKD